MEKGKQLKTVNVETEPLPEVLIQHIQSFMSREEAARSTVISKAWYAAWSTRPTLDLDPNSFEDDPESNDYGFAEYAMSWLQRYLDSNLNLDSFTLHMHRNRHDIIEPIANELILKALKLGATELNLEFSSNRSLLPREVLESETLVRLSVGRRTIHGSVKCSGLKSLSLDNVLMRSDDMFWDIISCCKMIEELKVTERNSSRFGVFSGDKLLELHKLRDLYLERVVVDPSFFITNFGSRFPCLKNLSLVRCSGTYERIRISSPSLESVKIEVLKYGEASTVELQTPNLVYFSYSGEKDIRTLRIQSSREWESHVFIRPSRPHDARNSLYFRLKYLLSQLSPSNNTLSMKVGQRRSPIAKKAAYDEGVVVAIPQPLAVETLTIDPPFASSYTLLIRLFKICRPKFLKIHWSFSDLCQEEECIASVLDRRFMKEKISPKRGIPDQVFGQIGLMEVSMEIYGGEREARLLNEGIDDVLTNTGFVGMFLFQLRWG